jgi:hypothetical protein
MSEIFAYPAPPDFPQSPDYRVDVNGVSIWTERIAVPCDPSWPGWFRENPWVHCEQKIDVTNFSASGGMEITITVPEAIWWHRIRPAAAQVKAAASGNRLTIHLDTPRKLVIAVNYLPQLFLFANPPEDPPAQGAGVRYFGPGTHAPGIMTLDSNETVYIAGGAIVYGGLRNRPGASNIRVLGRGVLDGSRLDKQKMVEWTGASNLLVDGIITRCGHTWQHTPWDCMGVIYRNVKVVSFGWCCDGIDPCGCRDVLIRDCLMRCTDDCIAIKSYRGSPMTDGITVDTCILYGHANSDGVTVGYELTSPIVRNILIKNCDVLETRGGNAMRTTHSAFSIICDGAAEVGGLRIEDCRVEEDMLCLFDLAITNGHVYVKSAPGHIRDVRLKNVSWASSRPIRLKGFDADHLVERVTFDKCRIAGKPLAGFDDAVFETNEFARDVRFV